MLTESFYITNAIVLLSCLSVAGWLLFRKSTDSKWLTLCRRFLAITLILLAAHEASLFTIVRAEGIETYATQPLSLLSMTFGVLAMGGSAAMRRNHWRTPANWGVLLFAPVLLFSVNLLMVHSGLYRPICTVGDMAEYKANAPLIYTCRLVFVAFDMSTWLLSIGILIEAIIYSRWLRSNRPFYDEGGRMQCMVGVFCGWAVLLMGGIVPMCISHLLPYVVLNVIYLAALWPTVRIFHYLMRLDDAKLSEQYARILIGQRVPQLLSMEQGGCTPWGITVDENPFFCGRVRIDAVANAIGVSTSDVSDYLAEHGTNLAAWASEQRLLHCASQLAETDRKIIEIAISCGYQELPPFTRAFKRRFGVSPSEYRRRSPQHRDASFTDGSEPIEK